MKHVYPIRHPASLDSPSDAQATKERERVPEPVLPHEKDESSHSQARATPQQEEIGLKAYGNATDGSTDTDRGPVMDQVYNEKVAPRRGPAEPRQ
ncbi:MAG: hypothetical protein ABIR54_07245 [Burkholderiaceae bacterium]|jgi:hypothetical protein